MAPLCGDEGTKFVNHKKFIWEPSDMIFFFFLQDILVNKRCRVDRRIGEGGFGLVYAGSFLFPIISTWSLRE